MFSITSINVCCNCAIDDKSIKLCVVLRNDVRICFGYRDISDMTCEKMATITIVLVNIRSIIFDTQFIGFHKIKTYGRSIHFNNYF